MRNGRTIYYLGNKAHVSKSIAAICFEEFGGAKPAFDVFAGSASVARAFSGYMPVIANDIQVYSWKLCRASLQCSLGARQSVLSTTGAREMAERCDILLRRFRSYLELECELTRAALEGADCVEGRRLELASQLRAAAGPDSPIVSEYGAIYFTIRNACELQTLLDFATEFVDEERLLVEATVLSLASWCAVTVGNQFAQPQKFTDARGVTKRNAVLMYQRRMSRSIIPAAFDAILNYPYSEKKYQQNICLNMKDIDAVVSYGPDAGFLYLDPPYGREHYSRYYHVLESMATGDYSVEAASSTRMRVERFQSPYSIRSQAEDAFDTLLSTARHLKLPVAVSFVDETAGAKVANRVFSIDDVRRVISRHFSSLKEHNVSSRRYSQMNRIPRESDKRITEEVLIIAR